MEQTNLLDMNNLRPNYYFWRYSYILTATDVQDGKQVLTAGPMGYGVLVTETDEFPTDALLAALSTPSCKLTSVTVWQIDEEEYARLQINQANDWLGAFQQARTKEMLELAKKDGQLTPEKVKEYSSKPLTNGPVIKHTSEFLNANQKAVSMTEKTIVTIPTEDEVDDMMDEDEEPDVIKLPSGG